jgi:hypothetical protein
MSHDYLADIAAYRAMYGDGWEDETVATFRAMIDQIPTLIKLQTATYEHNDAAVHDAKYLDRKLLAAARFPSIFTDPFADTE